MAPKLNRYKIRAVESFIRLSPSSKTINLRGTLNFLIMDVAAEASVGERIAPSKKASGQLKPGRIILATAATVSVVKSTNPKANCKIGLKLNLKSRHEVKYAAENKIGGKNSSKIIVGLILNVVRPVKKLMIQLPAKRKISSGMRKRVATGTDRTAKNIINTEASMKFNVDSFQFPFILDYHLRRIYFPYVFLVISWPKCRVD